MGYIPTPANAHLLKIALGYVNVSCNVTGMGGTGAGQDFVCDVTMGFSLDASDVGNIIMVFGAGVDGAPLWTTIDSVGGANNATLHDASTIPVLTRHAIIYRVLAENIGNGDFVLKGSVSMDSSLTTRASFNFTVHSPDGSFSPQPGQPVLAYDGTGDRFGGMIQQTTPAVIGLVSAIQTQCQCVSWDILLTRANLQLRSTSNPTTTNGFPGDGSTVSWDLTAVPLVVTDMKVNGVAVTFTTVGGSPARFYWDPTSTTITVDPSSSLPSGQTLIVTFTYVAALEFSNVPAGNIVESLGSLLNNVVANADDGVTVFAVTGPTIVQIQFQISNTINDVLSALCQYISDGTNNYWYYMDARRGLHFDIQGVTVAAPWNIDVSDFSDGNVLYAVKNTRTLEKIANAAIVELNNTAGVSQDQKIAGDGTKRTFSTTYPVASILAINVITNTPNTPPTPPTVTSVPQTFGIVGDPITGHGKLWYWSPNSSNIIQDAFTGTTLGIHQQLEVAYLPFINAVQTYKNTTDIALRQAIEGGSGEYDTHETPSSGSAPFLSGSNLAQIIAQYYAGLSESVQITSYRSGLASGQSITINLPGIAASGTYVVDSVRMVDTDHMLVWTITCIRGAAIGDWKTAFKGLSGAGGNSITAIGGSSGSDDGGNVTVDGSEIRY